MYFGLDKSFLYARLENLDVLWEHLRLAGGGLRVSALLV